MTGETAIAAAAIAFVAAVCQSVTAFGFALVMVPLLALAWDVKPAVVTSNLLSTVFMLPLLYQVRAKVELSTVGPLLAGSLLGVPVGLAVLDRVDAALLQVLVASVVMASSLALYFAPHVSLRRPHAAVSFLTGGLSGALRAATSMAGPPVVLYALASLGDEVERFRATVLAVLLPTSVVTIVAMALAGLIYSDVLIACAASLPSMTAGTLAGAWLRGRVTPGVFRPLVLSLLLAASAAVLATTFV